ncbi:putative methyltransferase-domain-containing protein [Blyttiomyces helicus]|uniref:Putative methyltransferase-domain-containing protein n=1 Tax=Blyttiomyces helicus TaxID=388810 RepID=A0A4P9WKJ5_9FUNG|nr:putative methyltransferase-domain-containing protein [Blyttiomyces helicus]|eukprot:RKO93519.1 putative methyltransferase-domain-containing protein [Blyttiomyces helicus]
MQTKTTLRSVTFDEPSGLTTTVLVHEQADAAYGCYIWPSALILSRFIHHHSAHFASSRILELGCGTGLPGLLASKLGAHVILTDSPTFPHVLALARLNVDTNRVSAIVAPLSWTDPTPVVAEPWFGGGFDWITGADVFYDPADFDDLFATVALLLRRSRAEARFLTAYQERSSRRSVRHLMDKWGLGGRLVPVSGFGGLDPAGVRVVAVADERGEREGAGQGQAGAGQEEGAPPPRQQ